MNYPRYVPPGRCTPLCPYMAEVCCDFGVCLRRMKDVLGDTCATEDAARWVSDHLIDMQDPDETCPYKEDELVG